MNQLEKELLLKQMNDRRYPGAGAVDAAMGLGNAALGYADDLVTPVAKTAQVGALNALGGVGSGAAGPMAKVARFAASPMALTGMKVATGVGALGGVMGAADVLAGNSSVGNKAMDATAMTIGGILGSAAGPLGAAAGAGIGKMVSDGTQWLFGDKKTPEQRKMELALSELRGGVI